MWARGRPESPSPNATRGGSDRTALRQQARRRRRLQLPQRLCHRGAARPSVRVRLVQRRAGRQLLRQRLHSSRRPPRCSSQRPPPCSSRFQPACSSRRLPVCSSQRQTRSRHGSSCCQQNGSATTCTAAVSFTRTASCCCRAASCATWQKSWTSGCVVSCLQWNALQLQAWRADCMLQAPGLLAADARCSSQLSCRRRRRRLRQVPAACVLDAMAAYEAAAAAVSCCHVGINNCTYPSDVAGLVQHGDWPRQLGAGRTQL